MLCSGKRKRKKIQPLARIMRTAVFAVGSEQIQSLSVEQAECALRTTAVLPRLRRIRFLERSMPLEERNPYIALLMIFMSSSFGTAPTTLSTSAPSLKRMRLGIARTLN
jgi:hypothetical protein